MYVNREARLVYLAHPRTASRATVAALMEQAGFTSAADGHHTRRQPEVTGGEWLAFTTVRNHFDALVSWYCYRYRTWPQEGAGGEPPFDPHWLREETTPWQGIYIRLAEGSLYTHLHLEDADRVLRYERLTEDLNGVLAERGLGPVELDEVGVSPMRRGRPYQAFYDDEMRRTVEEVFGEEIRRTGYTFEEADDG